MTCSCAWLFRVSSTLQVWMNQVQTVLAVTLCNYVVERLGASPVCLLPPAHLACIARDSQWGTLQIIQEL